jgi:hypothetical protein
MDATTTLTAAGLRLKTYKNRAETLLNNVIREPLNYSLF